MSTTSPTSTNAARPETGGNANSEALTSRQSAYAPSPEIIKGSMPVNPLAGKPAPPGILIDVAQLEREFFDRRPDTSDPNQLVSFGTSGHRGTSLNGTFTEAHILAITQAVCEYRTGKGIEGPLFMGKDTHALSESA